MRLVVLDGYRRELKDAGTDDGHMRLLPLRYPSQALIDEAKIHGRDLAPDMFLPFAPLAVRAKQVLKEFVPRYYAQLPFRRGPSGYSLADSVFPGDPAGWWLTDMSEKSVFRGTLIARLYSLALVRAACDVHRPAEVWIALADAKLAKVIADSLGPQYKVRIISRRPWFRKFKGAFQGAADKITYPCRAVALAFGTLAELVLLKLLVGTAAESKSSSMSNRQVALFSFFPIWWRNAWDAENRREVFYQGLPQGMSAAGFAVRHVVWLRVRLLSVFKDRVRIRTLARSNDFLCLQSLCSLTASGRLLGAAPIYCWRALHWQLPPEDRAFAGFTIESLVREELLRTTSDRELFRNLLLRHAVKKLPDFDLLLFRIEFQPFERALLLGLGTRRTTTVGYQHSSIGEDYLSHVFAPGEIGRRTTDAVASMPVPDHIVTTGSYAAQLMLKNGFSADQVHIVGPLRYQQLRSRWRERGQAPAKANEGGKYPLLIPVSLDYNEALSFAAVLAEALVGSEHRFVLEIKGHPTNDHGPEFLHRLQQKTSAINGQVVPATANLYDCIGRARALIMTGSTVGLEAIALGTPVVMFVNDTIFSFTASSLNAVGPAVIKADDVVSLRQALRRLYEEETPFAEARPHWPGAIEAMFDDLALDPEERFCTIVGSVLANAKSGGMTDRRRND
ncbi:MAG: hypothetical protein HY308_12215 [Gammaproteobacteria bacterium]|nr:hypothetical protein [Gammaproteobacteria bacterium]